MTMGRYLCQLCYTMVHYGEKHPCFFYKNDDAVYTIPQLEETDTNHCGTREEYARNSNGDYGNIYICETTEQPRSNSPALTSAHSTSCIDKKDNMLAKDFTDRPSFPFIPINAPNRKGEMDANEKQPLEFKKDAGAMAGPSTVHPHSLGPGGKRQYVCDVCHKQFKQKGHLVDHYKIHTGEKPFVCEACGKEFAQKANLTKHARTHTGEKPFVCGTCGKEFAQKANLTKHARTHTGEKPFVCDTCGREFNEKGHLNKHIRTHTGEKPFVCDICGREFTRKGSLEVHLRTHTGERPYVCDICGRSFADGSNFKRHVVIHKGGKRFTCSVCRKSFGSNEDRNRHFQEKH